MKRVLAGGIAAALLPCAAVTALDWLALGPSWTAVIAGPRLAWRESRPRTFAGLPDSPAVAVLRESFGTGVRPADGRALYDLAVARGYRRVLDVGTARGYAALWLALAMRRTGGRVVTIDIDPAAARAARENFRRAGLADRIDSRVNDALLEIPALPGDFDLVFLDPGVPLNRRLLDLVLPRLRPGSAILAHNAYFLYFGQRDYLAAIRSHPRLDNRILPTLSGGLAISTLR